MRRRVSALFTAVAIGGMVGGVASPANAAKPDWAGPPERSTVPIVGSGEPDILCEDRRIEFTGGRLLIREQDLPRGRGHGGFRLLDVTASDGEVTYRVVGQVRFQFSETKSTFSVHLVFRGPRGEVETVQSKSTFRDGRESTEERGSCSLLF